MARQRRGRRLRSRGAGGRYQACGRSEMQYEPGSNQRVLRNLLGIRSIREITRIERSELVRTTEWAARCYTLDHCFSSGDIRGMHKTWLGDIYAWAGEYRQVNISKGGFLFAAAGHIPRLMDELEADSLARHTPLTDRCGNIALALAETHTELLLIHPFREGNGRMARLLASLMASQAGIELPDFETLLQHRSAEYFAAVRAGLDRNYEPMRRMFASIIDGDD